MKEQEEEEEEVEDLPWTEKKDSFLLATIRKGQFVGTVVDIGQGKNTKERLYTIRYSDGDMEHFTKDQVRQHSLNCGPRRMTFHGLAWSSCAAELEVEKGILTTSCAEQGQMAEDEDSEEIEVLPLPPPGAEASAEPGEERPPQKSEDEEISSRSRQPQEQVETSPAAAPGSEKSTEDIASDGEDSEGIEVRPLPPPSAEAAAELGEEHHPTRIMFNDLDKNGDGVPCKNHMCQATRQSKAPRKRLSTRSGREFTRSFKDAEVNHDGVADHGARSAQHWPMHPARRKTEQTPAQGKFDGLAALTRPRKENQSAEARQHIKLQAARKFAPEAPETALSEDPAAAGVAGASRGESAAAGAAAGAARRSRCNRSSSSNRSRSCSWSSTEIASEREGNPLKQELDIPQAEEVKDLCLRARAALERAVETKPDPGQFADLEELRLRARSALENAFCSEEQPTVEELRVRTRTALENAFCRRSSQQSRSIAARSSQLRVRARTALEKALQ